MARRRATHKNDELSEFNLKPLTQTQSEAIQEFREGMNLLLTGYAGTGKTYLACGLGLEALYQGDIRSINVFRSAVPSRNIGFLPGSEAEKIASYEKAIRKTFNNLLRRGDGYDILKNKGKITFESTSFQRGETYDKCLMIVEEVQNLSWTEIDTLVTRLGKGSRVILAGDTRQTDLRDTGFFKMQSVVEKMEDDFSHIRFGVDDIVRSDFVRNWIISSSEETDVED